MPETTPTSITSGYPVAAKIQLAIWTAVWCGALWVFNSTGAADRVLLTLGGGGLFTAVAWFISLFHRVEVNAEQITLRTWRGRQAFLREDLQAIESVSSDSNLVQVLLHFRTGVAFLAPNRGCAHPEQILAYLRKVWNADPDRLRLKPVGPVQPTLTMRYERFHTSVLVLALAGLIWVGLLGPYMWVCFGMALVCLRALYFCTMRISTDETGVLIQRFLGPPTHLDWKRIESIKYWSSLVQGGVKLSDGVRSVSIYRWVGNYPRFIALIQDRVKQEAFPKLLELPCTVNLNQYAKVSWMLFALLLGAGGWLALEGYHAIALVVVVFVGMGFLVVSAGSGRTLHLSYDGIRDVRHAFFRGIL